MRRSCARSSASGHGVLAQTCPCILGLFDECRFSLQDYVISCACSRRAQLRHSRFAHHPLSHVFASKTLLLRYLVSFQTLGKEHIDKQFLSNPKEPIYAPAVPQREVAAGQVQAETAALRASWQFSAILDFFEVFQELLRFGELRFGAEELEAVLICSNGEAGLLPALHLVQFLVRGPGFKIRAPIFLFDQHKSMLHLVCG